MLSSWTFFREFVRSPSKVGSVVPSSKALARTVVETAEVSPTDVVLELGSGTGPVTAELVRQHPDLALLCLEPAAHLARLLRERVPGVDVVERRADRTLPTVVEAWGHPHVDRVVSGLPWTMWPDSVQDDVLEGITSTLVPDGRFLTYSYLNAQISPAGIRFRERLEGWFDTVWRTPVQWRNVPPAVVVVCEGPRQSERFRA